MLHPNTIHFIVSIWIQIQQLNVKLLVFLFSNIFFNTSTSKIIWVWFIFKIIFVRTFLSKNWFCHFHENTDSNIFDETLTILIFFFKFYFDGRFYDLNRKIDFSVLEDNPDFIFFLWITRLYRFGGRIRFFSFGRKTYFLLFWRRHAILLFWREN